MSAKLVLIVRLVLLNIIVGPKNRFYGQKHNLTRLDIGLTGRT